MTSRRQFIGQSAVAASSLPDTGIRSAKNRENRGHSSGDRGAGLFGPAMSRRRVDGD